MLFRGSICQEGEWCKCLLELDQLYRQPLWRILRFCSAHNISSVFLICLLGKLDIDMRLGFLCGNILVQFAGHSRYKAD